MPSKPERRKLLRKLARKALRQQRKEKELTELYDGLYGNRKPRQPKIIPSASAQEKHVEARRKRLEELRATRPWRIGNHRICKHPLHIGPERRIPDELFDRKAYLCVACVARDKHQAKTFEYLRRVNMARDKLLDAIVGGKLGVGTLKDFYHAALREFGGIDGIVACIKAEYEAADEGSQIRKMYLEMIVKVMVALSTMGQDEDVEQLPDEEVANRVRAMRAEAAKLL